MPIKALYGFSDANVSDGFELNAVDYLLKPIKSNELEEALQKVNTSTTNKALSNDQLEVGYDIPAAIGMDESEIQTPCLILDLDALERNIKKMGDYAKAHGMRHRVHGKMHKSVDVAKLQEKIGGAVGVCCQKVSEAEVFVRGGIKDVLVSNQVRDPAKIDRLAQLPKLGSRIIVCVDDLDNVAELSAAESGVSC